MILLVPISPEVPPQRSPKIWPALVMVLVLSIAFLESGPILRDDQRYLQTISRYFYKGRSEKFGQDYLSLRPLLKIAPCKASWDLRRLAIANFLHGSATHLSFNLIGAFAAVRVCSTFLGILPLFAVFIVGGSIGLLSSILVSSSATPYIPHVGASAGIFALFGAYFIFNRQFRTRYFFWYPTTQRKVIALKTSTFFVFDAILLEAVLSAIQLLPGKADSVDHVAHIAGFASGVLLAVAYRAILGWPDFIQTRGEFRYWMHRTSEKKSTEPALNALYLYMDLLAVNPFNDLVKIKTYSLISRKCGIIPEVSLQQAIALATPTFIRRNPEVVASVALALYQHSRDIPRTWLEKTPFDSVILIAHGIAAINPHQPDLLIRFIGDYRRIHEKDPDIERKLELLMQKLSAVSAPPKPVAPTGT